MVHRLIKHLVSQNPNLEHNDKIEIKPHSGVFNPTLIILSKNRKEQNLIDK